MNWESNLVLVDIERFIMEKGYGCKTETLPTETLPALAALERGDLDINTEVWLNSVYAPWDKAEQTGKVKRIGDVSLAETVRATCRESVGQAVWISGVGVAFKK